MEKLLTTADIDGEDIVQYYLDQVATGDSRPAEVVLALLADWWPGRTFRQSVSDEGLTCSKTSSTTRPARRRSSFSLGVA